MLIRLVLNILFINLLSAIIHTFIYPNYFNLVILLIKSKAAITQCNS